MSNISKTFLSFFLTKKRHNACISLATKYQCLKHSAVENKTRKHHIKARLARLADYRLLYPASLFNLVYPRDASNRQQSGRQITSTMPPHVSSQDATARQLAQPTFLLTVADISSTLPRHTTQRRWYTKITKDFILFPSILW